MNCSVIIPTREIDEYTFVAIDHINKYYNIPIIAIVDQVIDIDKNNLIQIKSQSPNLSFKRNLGVDRAKTKYIAFLDSDAYPLENWLEPAIDLLEQKDDVGIIGGPNLEYDKIVKNQKIPYLASRSIFMSGEPVFKRDDEIFEVNTLSSSNMVFRKKDFIKVGQLNENVFTGEDTDLCFRFKKINKRNIFHSLVKVRHKRRSFKGFLKQRFVWGRGVFTVLKYVFPKYILSLLPLLGVLINLLLISFDILNQTIFAIYFNLAFLFVCYLESLRITKSLQSSFKVFPYIYFSLWVLGFGTLYSCFRGDIDNDYSMYENSE